jgi:hypothetical protein
LATAIATPAEVKRQSRSAAILYAALAFGIPLLLLHGGCLRLPYFWDELGQFVPAALDILRDHAWIPKSTLPNVHPPGVMAYLALTWKVFGYSIPATRLAMLALADVGLVALFFLSVEIAKPLPGSPAFMPVILLLASPLFFTQSMMAQLDMPAMVFTLLALYLFLRDRFPLCALACTALVLAKETGAWVPVVFGACLLWEKRARPAAWFLIPIAALCLWLGYLWHATGTIFGNAEFKQYNVWFPLHPVRLSLTILRRLFFIFIENFHWIGTLALLYALRRSSLFRTRTWAVVTAIAAGHLLLVSVLGGAALERYLLPIVPLFYIAVAAAWTLLPARWQLWSKIALPAGLLASLFWNPPWPFPYENNLAAVDFVKVHANAAEYLEASYSDKVIASAWPFPDALRRPEFGYVTHPLKTRGLDDFNRSSVLPLKSGVDVLVVYSRTWEPTYGILRIPSVASFFSRYYYYEPQITREEIETELGLHSVGRYERRGQWIEIYARDNPSPGALVQLRTPPPSRLVPLR